MTVAEEAFVMDGYRRMFGVSEFVEHKVPLPAEYGVCPSRISPPPALARICITETYDRALHAHSKGYTDYLRIMLNRFASAPDVVAYPENEQDVIAALDWADSIGAVVIPFGGGSSVMICYHPVSS